MDPGVVGAIITILGAWAHLAHRAGRIESKVENTADTLAEVKNTVEVARDEIGAVEERVSRIEGRLNGGNIH